MIYLASPYSHPDNSVRDSRFREVCRVAAALMAGGRHVFSPIAHSHPIAMAGALPTHFAYWEAYDEWFVTRCEELWVLTLDGWKDSVGVKAEIEIAIRHKKTIRLYDGAGHFVVTLREILNAGSIV